MEHSVIVIVLAVLVSIVTGVWWITTFNRLVAARAGVHSAQGTTKAQLQRRWDQLPDVTAAVRSLYGHESEIYREMAECLRSGSDPSRAFAKLNALAVPTLSSGVMVSSAIAEQAEIERQIAASRRLVSAAVANYDSLRLSFPAAVVAITHGFSQEAYPEHVAGAEHKPVVW